MIKFEWAILIRLERQTVKGQVFNEILVIVNLTLQ